jgi:hypothetical protein
MLQMIEPHRPFWAFLDALADFLVDGRYMRPEDSMALMSAARDEMRATSRRREPQYASADLARVLDLDLNEGFCMTFFFKRRKLKLPP